MLVLLSINCICHVALQHAYATCLLSGFFEEETTTTTTKTVQCGSMTLVQCIILFWLIR